MVLENLEDTAEKALAQYWDDVERSTLMTTKERVVLASVHFLCTNCNQQALLLQTECTTRYINQNLAILDFGNSNFLTARTVKRPILHNLAKFRKDRSNCWWYITIFEIFMMAAAAILVFEILNFNDMPPVGGQSASACQISSKSVTWLQRYGNLTGFFSTWRPPPSWICRACIGTTHEDYLVVCIVVLNLVWIAAVLSII